MAVRLNPRLQGIDAWDEIEKCYKEKKSIIGRVVDITKGGLVVDVGVRAFLPTSEIDLVPAERCVSCGSQLAGNYPAENFEPLLGKTFSMRIVRFNANDRNLVMSRRDQLKVEAAERRAERGERTLPTLVKGDVIKGKIMTVVDYGVFVDLGGLDGLMHITQIPLKNGQHPSEMFKRFDYVEVVILSIDLESKKVSLGYRKSVASGDVLSETPKSHTSKCHDGTSDWSSGWTGRVDPPHTSEPAPVESPVPEVSTDPIDEVTPEPATPKSDEPDDNVCKHCGSVVNRPASEPAPEPVVPKKPRSLLLKLLLSFGLFWFAAFLRPLLGIVLNPVLGNVIAVIVFFVLLSKIWSKRIGGWGKDAPNT